MYAGPPTSSSWPDRPSSSFKVTRSIASPRSASFTILSKMRWCAWRKKSIESITSAARLNASLCSRMAPRTDRSASRLCGSVRSATATSAIGKRSERESECTAKKGERRTTNSGTKKNPEPGNRPTPSSSLRTSASYFRLLLLRRVLRFAFGDDFHFHVSHDVAVQFDRHVELAQFLDRFLQHDLPPIDLHSLRVQRVGDIARRHRSIK